MSVNIWQEQVVIPTYQIGKAEKYPVFLEKRVYQGSSGVVYPNPVVEKIFDEKQEQEWNALFLENDYLKIMILPELGGRVQMAYDKVKQRHFVYYNQVIKPALVGLTGPWISGGIEFNWPQHHRPSTYEPVDYDMQEHEDGSKTVWVSELEKMFRTKGMIGFTIYPDKAYLELNVKLYNRTPHPQTFLWWANPAVKVNDDYQSVFPPDVHAVFDHGKRDVSKFPIATGTYYKMDYSAGVDISRYKNIPVPTSYMAQNSKFNFVGGYENDSKGGLLHVANHHISPGKKQWTWGNGDFGVAWDRNLTDEDGPYIELMCGVYTDNQPDFTWLQPYEEKSFSQYFMPYQELGVVKNASKDLMLNIDFNSNQAQLKVYSTGILNDADIVLKSNGNMVFNAKNSFKPGDVFDTDINLDDNFNADSCWLGIIDENGKELLSWTPQKDEIVETPDPAIAAKRPEEIANNELLYLNGLHLEQYRHATYRATDYYLEALKRDPEDSRNNNAMGLWLMRRAKFKEAEKHLRTAIKRLTLRNPNPYDGEAYFNLGMCLRYQGRFDEAYEAFYKSNWNAAWQDAGYFNVALIDCRRGDWELALEHIERSLSKNTNNHMANHLKVVILRALGLEEEAAQWIEKSLLLDRFNFGVWHQKYLLTNDQEVLDRMKGLMRDVSNSYVEYVSDYVWAGMYDEALALLKEGMMVVGNDPIMSYFNAWVLGQKGDTAEAKKVVEGISAANDVICFPNKLEEILALQFSIEIQPEDYRAMQYLGNFFYAYQHANDAIVLWEKSLAINNTNPIVLRNLGLAAFNKQGDAEKAVNLLEKAFENDNNDARLLMELDSLYKRVNKSYDERLAVLEAHPELVEYRDDLYLENQALNNLTGKFDKALVNIQKHQFHPWEGGEGKVPEQYFLSLVSLAKLSIANGQYKQAIEFLNMAQEYPHNLGEGKLQGAQENDVFYWIGCAYDGMGDDEKAVEFWEKASSGLSEFSAAMYYNDQQPDKVFYQGLANLKLGNTEKARSVFNRLKDYGEKHIFDNPTIDYFAVSLPDLLIWDKDLKAQNILHCKYLIGLGELGLGNFEVAQKQLQEVVDADLYHLGAVVHLNMIKDGLIG